MEVTFFAVVNSFEYNNAISTNFVQIVKNSIGGSYNYLCGLRVVFNGSWYMTGTHTPICFVFEPVEQNSVSNFDLKRRYLTMVEGGR